MHLYVWVHMWIHIHEKSLQTVSPNLSPFHRDACLLPLSTEIVGSSQAHPSSLWFLEIRTQALTLVWQVHHPWSYHPSSSLPLKVPSSQDLHNAHRIPVWVLGQTFRRQLQGQGAWRRPALLLWSKRIPGLHPLGLKTEVIFSLAFSSEDSWIQPPWRAPDHGARESRRVLRWLSWPFQASVCLAAIS